MTIVASNSLTVSNINDGTITHVAFAYSADGTDRFTTVYPNLNLLKNTKTKSYISTGTAGNSSSSSDPNAYASDTTAFTSALLTISYDYAITNSVGTWSGFIRPTYGIGGTNKAVSSTNLTGSHKETVQIGLSENSKSTIFALGLPTATSIKIDNLKIEFGDTASPWIGSKSETKPSDFPNFRGEYSDKLTTQSQTPSDYKWLVFQGPTGATGAKGDPTGVTKQATEPASSERFIGMLWQYTGTSSISITGTTATPNAIYRWIGSAWELWYFYAVNIQADTISAVSSDLGKMKGGSLELKRELEDNKTYGLFESDRGILSTGFLYAPDGTKSASKMGVARMSNGEMRFVAADYLSDLEALQNYGLNDPDYAYIRYEKKDLEDGVLSVMSSGKLLLSSKISGQTHYYDFGKEGLEIKPDMGNTGNFLNSSIEIYGKTPYIDFHFDNSVSDFSTRIISDTASSISFQTLTGFAQLKASAFTVSSSKDFKYNILDIDPKLDELMTYSFKKYRRTDGTFQMGLVLEDVDRLQISDSSKTGIDLYSLVSVIGKSVQELSDKVDVLSEENSFLKNKLESLENR